MSVVLLSGGTGGAKLARGLYDLLGEELAVIANTGDDIEIYGAHVSPDPDLVSYRLADCIDERGFGIAGDSFAAMEMLERLGAEAWCRLGDRDLALCLRRRTLLEAGRTLSEAHAELSAALGVRARVIPMSDDPVRTAIRSGERLIGLQEFLIRERGAGPIDDVSFEGAERAAASPAALAALEDASAVVIGPSNPIISIGPILAVGELRAALEAAAVPVIAVSPIVAGSVLKGPTAACLTWAGRSVDAAGVAEHYGELIDAIVADEPVAGIRCHRCETRMDDPGARRELARETLALAEALRG